VSTKEVCKLGSLGMSATMLLSMYPRMTMSQELLPLASVPEDKGQLMLNGC